MSLEYVTFSSDVKTALETANSTVRSKAIDLLVDQKIKERVDLVVKGQNKRKEAEKALSKIKPTPLGFDANGQPVNPIFTKEQNEEKTKLEKLINDLDAALVLAMANPSDYSKLEQLAK